MVCEIGYESLEKHYKTTDTQLLTCFKNQIFNQSNTMFNL